MAQVALTMAVVMAVLAVVLIGIATAITGIISTRNAGDTKTRLLASSALSGFTAIFAVVAALLGIFFARAKRVGNKATGLGIAFLVVAILTLLMYITVIALNVTARNAPNLSSTEKNAITAAIILIALGFVALTISTILFFTLTKGKSGKEAMQAIKFQRRSGSRSAASPTATGYVSRA